MTLALLVLIIVKILIIFGFLLNAAALCTWGDRRQGALVQHRVGPNRAVVKVPSTPMRIVLFAIGVALGAPFGIFWWNVAPVQQLGLMTIALEVAVGVTWLFFLMLSAHVRKKGAENGFEELVGRVDPRHYFYAGLVAHLLVLGLPRVIPTEALTSDITYVSGIPGSLAFCAIAGAIAYVASKLPDDRTEIRLAGTLHAIADSIKMIWKEDLRPKDADKLLFELAPVLSLIPALITCAVIPFGNVVCFRDVDRSGDLQFGELLEWANVVQQNGACPAGYIGDRLAVADLNVGLLFIFAIAGTGIIGAAIAGWASDSKFALLGGLRATSQMVSYEVAMGLAIVGMLMVAGSVHLGTIVDWQGENTWGIFAQPLGFILFFTAVMAETKRVPFDQPEGESEIVAGYFLEYSGFKWGIFMTGEYAEFAFSSLLMVTLFFGGYHLPFLDADGLRIAFGANVLYELKLTHLAVTVIHVLAFFGKVTFFIWFHLFVRWTLPRFRYDQLMKLGWTKLLPLSLVNILVTGIVILAIDAGGAGVMSVLDVVADLTQALIALGGLLGLVAFVTFLLEPPKRQRLALSTTARFADATGGVKPTEMQA
jgi:NADH-quinone oxidoreductase subunit H